jgi:hypothetical protein
MNINLKILEVASRFEGLVELKSNAKWGSKKLKAADPAAAQMERMLKRSGHQDGWPYCMSFCEMVWHVAYEEIGACQETIRMVCRLLNPSVMQSWANVKEAGLNDRVPKLGAIFFMQKGTSGYGHAGIVEDHAETLLHTIEANTSPQPGTTDEDRDGGVGTGGVWRRRRAYRFGKGSGLHLVGFLNPPH